MRILLVNHEFTITGASTVLFRLARHLRDGGHAVTLFPINPAPGPMLDRYAAVAIPVAHTVVARDFDLAVGNTICAAPVVIQLAPFVPTVWYVHEAEVGLDLLLRNPAWIAAFGSAAKVLYDMPFQHDVYRSFTYRLDPHRCETLSCGIEVDLAAVARHRAPPKERALRIVQVGTMEPRKRPGDLIEAVARSGLDAECVICGKLFDIGETARAIVARDPGRFRLLEGLEDGEVLGFVASADIFCLASISETQGLAAYEAALLRRALLLSDLPCYRGVFAHGRSCILFPPGDVELLAHSLALLASSAELRLRLGAEARAVASRFDNARFFAGFDAVLHDVTRPSTL